VNTALSDLARVELEMLSRDGIVPTWDDVAELNALGWQVLTPDTRRHLARGTPVRVGGKTLLPLTVNGWAWYSRVGDQCADQNAAFAYALARGYDEALQLATEADVEAWKATLTATSRELVLAVGEVIDQDRKPETPPAKQSDALTSVMEIGAVAMAHVGGTPEMWERHVCIGYIAQVMEAVARSQGGASGKPDPTDPRIQAQAAIIWAVQKIRRRHTEQDETLTTGTAGGSNGG
jgi:uncharacterized membrane protein